MSTRSYIIVGILLVGAAIAFVVTGPGKKADGAEGSDPSAGPGGRATAPAKSAVNGQGKARTRGSAFSSVEEAEQALLNADMSFIRTRDQEDIRRGFYRLRALAGRIPEEYYSELTARFGECADKNIERHFTQMAIYQVWGRSDVDAALADVSGINDYRRHLKAVHSVFVGAADEDVEAAMRMAETRDIKSPGEFGDRQRIDLMDTIYDLWIESDPSNAIQWAQQAEVPDKRREQWINDGLRAWKEIDPAAAERWRKAQE